MACAKVKALAPSIDPDALLGTMIADGTMYPASCKPEDVIATMNKNRYQQYFYTDVQLRCEYPVYMLRYFADRNIHLEIRAEDGLLF